MALSSTTIQPVAENTNTSKEPINSDILSLLSMVVLSVYAGQKSRKQLRKIKRKMTWLLIKQRVQALFARPAVSDRKLLIYILLGLVILLLLIYYPIAALILAIIGLILLLTGTI